MRPGQTCTTDVVEFSNASEFIVHRVLRVVIERRRQLTQKRIGFVQARYTLPVFTGREYGP